MVTSDVNVLEQVVEVVGGYSRLGNGETRRRFLREQKGRYVTVGHTVTVWRVVEGEGCVLLFDAAARTETWVSFGQFDSALAEFERIKTQLWTRHWVEWVTTDLIEAGVLPEEFRDKVLSGEPQALLVAADWQDEHDRPYHGHLLRAAYHMVATGQVNVHVPVGKKAVVVLNPNHSKTGTVAPGIGTLRVVEVVEGVSVRIVGVEAAVDYRKLPTGRFESVRRVFVNEKVFGLGDQAEYDSFNLTYYGPIKTITAKTVVVEKRYETATARLTLATFVGKNHDFDLEKAQERNSNWSD